MGYFADPPGQPVRAVPGAGLNVPIWILGSSLFGAQLAARARPALRLRLALRAAEMMQAIDIYRASFQPSAQLDKPYVMLGFNVFAADTDDEARLLATSMQQAFVNLRSGRPARAAAAGARLSRERSAPQERAMLDQVLSCSAIGSPDDGGERSCRRSSRAPAPTS